MPRKQKTIHYLYKTTCLITDKYYIGMHSTSNLEDGYMGSGKRLRYSIRKYGKENHVKEILEFFDSRESLVEAEKHLVTKDLISQENCINLKEGGTGGFSSDEHRKKFFETTNVKNSHDRIKWLRENDLEWYYKWIDKIKDGRKTGKYNPSFLNKKHSDTSRKKISESLKGLGIGARNSQYGTKWITNGVKCKKIKKEDPISEGWHLGRK
jgi:hypothetical protein